MPERSASSAGTPVAEPLVDRHRQVFQRLQVEQLGERLRQLDEALRYGRPDLPGPAVFLSELEEIRRQARERSAISPDVLLLNVGYSPEPLLLALAHHSPGSVTLLLEQQLSRDYLERLQELWDTYRDLLEIPAYDDPRIEKRTVRGSPTELFQEVRRIVDHLKPSGKRVVLDITGAKKSMIAGAFLAAGFLDLEVSYVDFDSYDPILRRPDPGSCRPGHLRHPYRLFRIKEQNRIFEAFDDRHYMEARQLALELHEMAQLQEVQEILGLPEAARIDEAFTRVHRIADAYSQWGSGFYRDALDLLSAIQTLPVPETLTVLGPLWPVPEERPWRPM